MSADDIIVMSADDIIMMSADDIIIVVWQSKCSYHLFWFFQKYRIFQKTNISDCFIHMYFSLLDRRFYQNWYCPSIWTLLPRIKESVHICMKYHTYMGTVAEYRISVLFFPSVVLHQSSFLLSSAKRSYPKVRGKKKQWHQLRRMLLNLMSNNKWRASKQQNILQNYDQQML